jgi:outer membrane surface antigen
VGVTLLVEACGMPAQFWSSDRTNKIDPINFAENAVAFSSADFAAASAATTALLGHDDGASGPWENPLTGARGTITPLAAAYRDNGVECRDFLASFVRERAEAWMQGEACRNSVGRWEVRSLKLWRR